MERVSMRHVMHNFKIIRFCIVAMFHVWRLEPHTCRPYSHRGIRRISNTFPLLLLTLGATSKEATVGITPAVVKASNASQLDQPFSDLNC